MDVLAGLFATVGILAALEYRRDTGEGQRVEVDLLSSLLAALVNQASAYTVARRGPEPMGNQHPSIAPYEPLRCADRELVLAVGNDRQFGLLCARCSALPRWPRDRRFATNAVRVENRTALRSALEQRLAGRPAQDWANSLERGRRSRRRGQRHRARRSTWRVRSGLAPTVRSNARTAPASSSCATRSGCPARLLPTDRRHRASIARIGDNGRPQLGSALPVRTESGEEYCSRRKDTRQR